MLVSAIDEMVSKLDLNVFISRNGSGWEVSLRTRDTLGNTQVVAITATGKADTLEEAMGLAMSAQFLDLLDKKEGLA